MGNTLAMDALITLAPALLALTLFLLFRRVSLLLTRLDAFQQARGQLDQSVREELGRHRENAAREERQLREELRLAAKDTTDSLIRGLAEISGVQKASLDSFASHLQGTTDAARRQDEAFREAVARHSEQWKSEVEGFS